MESGETGATSVQPEVASVSSRPVSQTRPVSTARESESRVSTAATSRDGRKSVQKDATPPEDDSRSDGVKSVTNSNPLGLIIENPRKALLDRGQRRLRRQLHARTLRRKKAETLKLPRIVGKTLVDSPGVVEGYQPAVTIHHPQLGRIEHGRHPGMARARGARTSPVVAVGSARRVSARGLSRTRAPLSQPTPLPTIQENCELDPHPSAIPVIPSLVTAYRNLTFANQCDAGGSDDIQGQGSPARSVWRTLPMPSELDKYINFLAASKKQSHTFSRQVLPGLGFERGGLGRPRSPKQSLFDRQRTRFGGEMIWGTYKDNMTGKRTQASKLKSAQGRTDRLVSELKTVLGNKPM